MLVETSRFGPVEVRDTDVITFPEGMLGFARIDKYILIEDANDSLFVWLQALKRPTIAFPLLEPQLFDIQYRVELCEEDRKSVALDDLRFAKVFAIVTIPTDPSKMTANLKAPIVLNVQKRLAKQVILVDADYPIRQPAFADVQRYCATQQRPLFPASESTQYQAVPINEELGLSSAEQ